MANTSMYNTSGGLESGLRTGLVIGQGLRQMQSRNALQDAAGLIQQGQDPNAVIQLLMATDPAAAQQLLNMQTQQQRQAIQKQEMDMLQQKYGKQKLQMAAMPLLGAVMQDDLKVQDKLIDEASSLFKGQSDGVYATLQGIKELPLEQRVQALGGVVKMLRQAGVFPDDPSQMMRGQSADIAKFEYWKQLNPNATEQQQQEMYSKIIDPYSRAYATGLAKIETEQGLNPVLAAREAGKAEAVEGTAGGKAELAAQQAAAQKAQNEIKEEEIRKAKQIDLSKQAMMLAREVANDPMLGAVTGLGAKVPTINPASDSLIIKAQQLVAMLTSENMKLMSGVLTQADMELLQTLSTGLKVDEKGIKGSQQAVSKQLNMIADKIERTLMEKGALDKKQDERELNKPRNFEQQYMGRN